MQVQNNEFVNSCTEWHPLQYKVEPNKPFMQGNTCFTGKQIQPGRRLRFLGLKPVQRDISLF